MEIVQRGHAYLKAGLTEIHEVDMTATARSRRQWA